MILAIRILTGFAFAASLFCYVHIFLVKNVLDVFFIGSLTLFQAFLVYYLLPVFEVEELPSMPEE